MKVYVLYQTDAWHNVSSREIICPSLHKEKLFEVAEEFLNDKRIWNDKKINEDALLEAQVELGNINQTQNLSEFADVELEIEEYELV